VSKCEHLCSKNCARFIEYLPNDIKYNSVDATEYNLKLRRQFTHIFFFLYSDNARNVFVYIPVSDSGLGIPRT